MLIKYIEKYNLNDYSLIALGKKKADEPIFAKTEQPVIITVQQPITQAQIQQTSDVVKETIKKPVVNYPSGEFKINETKVVYAIKGTPFLAIAQKYNVQLKWLFDFNDLKEAEVLEQDQLIFLQRKRLVGANPFHVVATGETLYDIAQAQGIRLEALLKLNQIPVNKQPLAGEQLYLQSPAPVAPKFNNASIGAANGPTTVEPYAVASNEVIVPLQCEYFALHGFIELKGNIDKVKSFLNPELKLVGILATMYDRKTLHNREVLTAILEKYPEDVFETIIAKTIRFAETTVAGEPITAYASSSGGAQSYRRLARELIARGGAQ